MRKFRTVIMILFSCLVFLHCENKNLKEIINTAPRFNDKDFISLQKLYSIDVTTLISIPGGDLAIDYGRLIDFDENNNMYILDTGDNIITVLNDSGKIINTFGGTGQGPEEFNRSGGMTIGGGKIYVFEFTHNYKVVNLKGEYISKQTIRWTNRLKVDLIGDVFYVLEGETDRNFTDLDIVLNVRNRDFSLRKKLLEYKHPYGLNGPYYDFIFGNWILFSGSGEFYFPDDNINTFSITKYDGEGKPLLRFGRTYNVKPYSEEARSRFFRMYVDKGMPEENFPVSPPVVRNMILDDHNYIWVVSGETYEDNRNPDFQNTIDIFNQDGIWLYSFHPDFKSKNLIHNAGRLYVISPVDEETSEQFIDVYEIIYSGE